MARKALLLVVLAALGAAAAVPAAAQMTSGVVDLTRVGAEYKGMQELQSQLELFQTGREKELEIRRKARLLLDEERQEFLDLNQVAAPTEERARRLKELESLSDQRELRRFELRKKDERTEAEESELKELDDLYDKRMAELQALQADVQESIVAKYRELNAIVTESVNEAIKTVAEAKELTIVMRKDTVLFGGVDITDDVLTKLNGEPAASE
jgi:Skp family chaperone for outer membrane proteins